MRRYIPPEKNPRQTMLIILIGGALMLMIDYAKTHDIFPWRGSEKKTEVTGLAEESLPVMKNVHIDRTPDIIQEAVPLTYEYWENIPPEPEVSEAMKAAPPVYPHPQVAIIIDDMGMDRKHSFEVMEIDAPLTLAFLPYALKLPEITKQAREEGHELLIHVPMEPENPDLDLGGMGLRSGMDEAAFNDMLEKIFASFDGYIGINNHMGSKLTQDTQAMDRVMKALKKRDLLFVDSRTIAGSVAEDVAAAHGLKHGTRDVFLDHIDTPEGVRQSFERLEAVAFRNGHAIAIGHPKANTIAGLKRWIPEARKKGIKLVPVSAIVE